MAAGVKINPQVLIKTIKNKNHRAARVWYLAKSLDIQGMNHVAQGVLKDALKAHGIGGSHARRFIGEAVRLRLLIPARLRTGEKVFFYLSWGRGAFILGVQEVGKFSLVAADNLFCKGWRSFAWAAFESTLKEDAPKSQTTKERITGITPRTQRSYLARCKGARRVRQYAWRGRGGEEKVEGFKEYKNIHVFAWRDKVIQRLPNIVVVERGVAETCKKGRKAKAQKVLSNLLNEFSCNVARDKEYLGKLFYQGREGACKAARELNEDREVFYWGAGRWHLVGGEVAI